MKIFLLDKETLFRDGVKSLLLGAGHQVDCLAEDSPYLDQVHTAAPDIVFIEPLILDSDPKSILQGLKAAAPQAKLVFITADDKHSHLVEAIQAGAEGYLTKQIESLEFFEMIERLKRGEPAITPAVANLLFKVLRKKPGEGLPILTAIEENVLWLASEGRSNAAIAAELGISMNTVKFHLKKINTKLHTSNRTEAVMVALQTGALGKR